MQTNNEEALGKALKAGPPSGAYLLYGKEQYLISAYRNRITKKFSGEGGLFNLLQVDGRKLELEPLLDAVYNLPLMADAKCVVVEDLEPGKLSPKQQEELLGAIADLPDTCVLVITGRDAFDPQKAAAKKIIAAMDKAGVAARLDGRDPGGLTAFLQGAAKKRGCVISTALCRHMLRRCENDMHALSTEIAKVCAYAGEGEITQADIDAVIIAKTEARVFDLGKAVLAGNAARALGILGDLFYLREQPTAILSALAMNYIDLYRARIAKDSGATAAQIAGRLGYKGREFRIQNAFGGCSGMSAGHLRRALDALLDCERRMKSTGVDGRVLLEQTVVRLLVLGERAR